MKTILITGATSGLGYATAEQLLRQGHQVLLHGRDSNKLAKVELALAQYGNLATYSADLTDLASVKQMLKKLTTEHSKLDALINNAGVFKTRDAQTASGLDARLMVNAVSPYLICNALLPLLKDGRVINLSSAAQAPFTLDAFSQPKVYTDAMQAYAESKLALTCWTLAMANSIASAHTQFVAVNPGSLLATQMVKAGFGIQGKDINQAVSLLAELATGGNEQNLNGKYFDGDSNRYSQPHPAALNTALQYQLLQTLDQLITQ